MDRKKPRLLSFTDRVIPSGRVIEWSAIIEAGNTRLLEARAGQTAQGSIVGGDMNFANGLTTAIGVRRTGGPNLSLFTADTPGFDDLFGGASPPYADAQLHFQYDFTSVFTLIGLTLPTHLQPE